MLSSVGQLSKKYSDKLVDLNDHHHLMSTRTYDKQDMSDLFPMFQRFTRRFVNKLFERKEVSQSRKLLDCYMGSGNTLVGCVEHGKIGYGIDISPLFCFVAHVKTTKYSAQDFDEALSGVETAEESEEVDVPALSSFHTLFTQRRLDQLFSMKHVAFALEEKPKELLLFALVSELLRFSRAKRYGKGLHKKKTYERLNMKKAVIEKLKDIKIAQKNFYQNVPETGNSIILQGDARDIGSVENRYNHSDLLPIEDIDTVITSPPYCNSADYVEMYKLELWFLDFVKNYKEFKKISHSTIRSHLTLSRESKVEWTNPVIDDICEQLGKNEIWNKNIPSMIKGYFDDMHRTLGELKQVIRNKGNIFVVIGNSCYSGIVIPSDLLIAEAANDLGFTVNHIERARSLATSGQQLIKLDKNSKQLLRESIVVLNPN